MNRLLVVTAAAGLAAVTVLTTSPAGAGTLAGGAWEKAKEVAGALNTNSYAFLLSVSCASSGNCGAGGFYANKTGIQAFVISQVSGVWGKPERVPGTAGRNPGIGARTLSVSCAAAGNCSAGGFYIPNATGVQEAFVVSEVKGVWGQAVEVPGAAGTAAVNSVSCASAGNCGAGGFYTDSSGYQQTFVVSEVNGVWGQAEEAPGTGGANYGTDAEVNWVSCASVGNCGAGGSYTDGATGLQEPFVVSEVNGVWGQAEVVPGLAALNHNRPALVDEVSCASAGHCGAVGVYSDGSGHQQGFVTDQVNGVWRTAEVIPGPGAPSHVDASTITVSCASAGNCVAGGSYYPDEFHSSAFVVSEVNGVWGQAEEVPGIAALNKDSQAGTNTVSCGSAGNCSAGGYYASKSGYQAFVVSEVNGVWGQAEEVPGTAALNADGDAQVYSLSCASANHCSAGGDFSDGPVRYEAFVVSRT